MTINSIKNHIEKLVNSFEYPCAEIEIQRYGHDYFYNIDSPHPEAVAVHMDYWNIRGNSNDYFNSIIKLAKKIEVYAARYNLLFYDRCGHIVLMLPADRDALNLYDFYVRKADTEFCEYDHAKRERTGEIITDTEGRAIMTKWENNYINALASAKTV